MTAPRLLLLLLSLGPTIAGAMSPLARSCQGCHNPQIDAAPMIALNALPPARIEATLRDFADGRRTGTVMPRLARGLSAETRAKLAAELGRPP